MQAFASEVIDGQTYLLRPMSPEAVLYHGSRLTALLAAPAIQSLGKQADSVKEVTPAMMFSSLSQLVGEAMKNIGHPDVQACLNAMFDCAAVDLSVNGVGGQLELKLGWKSHFMGKPGTLVRFLTFAMGAQFGDFFAAMQGSLADALKKRFASIVSSAPTQQAPSPST